MNDATVVLGRECGKCSMCCQHMEIKELDKPFGPGAYMYVKEIAVQWMPSNTGLIAENLFFYHQSKLQRMGRCVR